MTEELEQLLRVMWQVQSNSEIGEEPPRRVNAVGVIQLVVRSPG